MRKFKYKKEQKQVCYNMRNNIFEDSAATTAITQALDYMLFSKKTINNKSHSNKKQKLIK